MEWIKMYEDVDIPKYQSRFASGMDVRAYLPKGSIHLYKGRTVAVPTGLKVFLDKGSEIQIRPRSGLAFNYSVTVLNTPGTIDEDYKGELKILLHNAGDSTFIIKDGERIAQAVYAPVFRASEYFLDNYESERGEGGFGSTGRV